MYVLGTLQGEVGGPGQKGSKGDKGELVSLFLSRSLLMKFYVTDSFKSVSFITNHVK